MSQFITPLEPVALSTDLKLTIFDASNDSSVNEQNSLRDFILHKNLLKDGISIPDIWTQAAINYLALHTKHNEI